MKATRYGSVRASEDGSVSVLASRDQLASWATRPRRSWPCSTLRRLPHGLSVGFDSGGNLVEMTDVVGRHYSCPTDVPADELSAWTSDVLTAAGMESHPAVRA